MRDMTFPESGLKRKILDAAEQLFAEKGFDAVSIRDITQLAEANVAGVNYYFGSRDFLLTVVLARCMTPITEERIARLDALERKWPGKSVPLEEIIDAMLRPFMTQVHSSELSEPLFFRLLGLTLAQQGDRLPPQIEEQLRHAMQRFTKAFAKALPALAPDELASRIHFTLGGMIHLLTHQVILQRPAPSGPGAPPSETTLGRLIRFAAVGLQDGLAHETPEEEGPQELFKF